MGPEYEILLDVFGKLEKKIDDNMVVRQDILSKLNLLVTDVSIIKKDFYGNGVEGIHKKVIRHEGYFLKLGGASVLISSVFTVFKIWKW